MNKTFSVKIDGFKTKKEAQTFVDWYEGQGEQDICTWLEYQDGTRPNMNMDMEKGGNWEGNVLSICIEE